MRSYIEYTIHRGEEWGQDLDFLEGKFWRKAQTLVNECKQGLHPDIAAVEKVTIYEEPVYYLGYNGENGKVEWEHNGLRDEESLYDREEEQ
tara:strand:+ start:120 stop:392 length:273 start_codon:yes stop_codon:yes gene_type:complete